MERLSIFSPSVSNASPLKPDTLSKCALVEAAYQKINLKIPGINGPHRALSASLRIGAKRKGDPSTQRYGEKQ